MATSAKAKAIGQRGKFAEKEVEKLFSHLNDRVLNFAYERLPDARSAGGRLKAQLCDFLAWWQYCGGERGEDISISYQIEVKEIAHAFRLPRDKLGQLPKLRKIRRAGGVGIVIIYHTSTEMWRAIPLGFFNGEAPPSWDLSGVPKYASLAEALNTQITMFPYVATPLKEIK